MADIAVQTISRTGLETAYVAAAAGGDAFVNDGRTFFHVKNGDVSDKTVTFVTQKTVLALAVADLAVVVTASEERMIGPFPTGVFNDGNNKVSVTYSAATSVTVAAIKL